MSALVGYLRLDDEQVVPEILSRMLATMPHRGQDGQHCWIRGPVGFGHRMMHTTPESLHETLPFYDDKADLAITSYSRIDNREELITILGLELHDSTAITDSELILKSYSRWGENCPCRLVGDFSFAVWDGRSEKLFCARDIIGMKPMYYAHKPGEYFVFATEPKALLSLEGVEANLNESRIADMLCEMRFDVEQTVYSDIFKVPPGHSICVTRGTLEVSCFGTLEPEKGDTDLSDEEYTDRFRELMYESVRCRLRSAFPVSSQLSGGLDSSFVTCIAAEILASEGNEILQTVSIIFEKAKESDEREFIDAVLDEINAAPDYIYGDRFGPLSDIESIYSVVEDALVGGNHHLIWRMLGKARENGARVVLDGLDGDTVIGHGYEYFRELARNGDWNEFAAQIRHTSPRYKELRHKHAFHDVLSSPGQIVRVWALPELGDMARRGELLKFIASVRALNRIFGISKQFLLRRNVFRMIVPHFIWRWRERRLEKNKPFCNVIDNNFADRIGFRKRLEKFKHKKPVFSTFRGQQQMSLVSGSLTGSFETLDHYSAAQGVDVRHPFMDIRLIRFCLALPPDQSLNLGWTRIIMRRAMESVVPEKVTWRPGKGNLTSGYEHGLFESDGKRLDDWIYSPGVAEQYMDMAYLRNILSNKYNLSPRENTDIERAAILSFWLNDKFA